jgi:hypothetical protein
MRRAVIGVDVNDLGTRRQEEITLLRWGDIEGDQILVRDIKHPGDKKGNNAYCELRA